MNKIVFTVIMVIIGVGCVVAQPSIGQQAYEIKLPDIKGKTLKLSDERGKIVLIDFWASWCGPCRKANPDLAALYSKYKNKGFEIFGVSIDDEKRAWKKAIQSDRINWKQVNSPGGWDAAVAVEWKLEQIPASFLIDQQGKVIAIDLKKAELEKYLQDNLR